MRIRRKCLAANLESGHVRFSPYLHRTRNLVERFFNKVKPWRRVATRYDKLSQLTGVHQARINRIWPRAIESTPLKVRTENVIVELG